jgi:hypothetical protein
MCGIQSGEIIHFTRADVSRIIEMAVQDQHDHHDRKTGRHVIHMSISPFWGSDVGRTASRGKSKKQGMERQHNNQTKISNYSHSEASPS